MQSLLTKPFLSLLPKELSGELSKVKKPLGLYAAYRKTTPEKLTLLDLCDDNGELSKYLVAFFETLVPSPRQNSRDNEHYKQESKSRIRRLVKVVLSSVNSLEESTPYLLHSDVPPFMFPVLHTLPRGKYHGNNRRTNPQPDANEEEINERLSLPLTDNGRVVLAGMLSIVEKYSLSTLESVLVDHAFDVISALKMLCPPKQWGSVVWSFGVVRKRLNFPVTSKGPKFYIDLEDWPPTLRKQWEIFSGMATNGPNPNSALVTMAAAHNIELRRLEYRTIDNYQKAIAKSLAYIPRAEDLDVLDLLTLTPIKRKIREGFYTDVLHNPLVDIFREHEMNLETDRKRRGYDSDIFQTFVTAIKTVAAFNGIVDLQRSFNHAYEINKDRIRKKEVKAFKKRSFELDWIDREIERLGQEFYRIIKAGAYKLENEAVGLSQRRKNLRLCAFYVVLITLRYMGYRQQCIRDCKVGKNIVFEKDGSITFRWESDEVKNDKELTVKLSKKNHGNTHGPMIDALLAHYRHVYPYLRKRAAEDGKKQFFLKLGRDKLVTSFLAESATCFGIQFKAWASEFLDYEGRFTDPKRGFNPHHLRGLCTDWLIYSLGLSLEDAAKIIGDTPETLKAEYLDKSQPCDASPILLKVNKSIRAEENAEKAEALEVVVENYRASLAQKEEQMNTLLKELSSTNERLMRAESEKAAQSVQLEAQCLELVSLRERAETNHREMMETLKSNGRGTRRSRIRQ